MKRLSWDEYFLQIALVVAKRATCKRAQIGAVLVKDRGVVATGYNGAPSGLPHCTDVGCLMVEGHCVRTIHGELNAILQAAKMGNSTEGTTLYTPYRPCAYCAKSLVAAGIRRIVFAKVYQDDLAELVLKQANIELKQINFPVPEMAGWKENTHGR